MNLTLDQLHIDWDTVSECLQKRWSVFYDYLMKRLKRLSRQAWVKALGKLNRSVQQTLIIVMRALHVIE